MFHECLPYVGLSFPFVRNHGDLKSKIGLLNSGDQF